MDTDRIAVINDDAERPSEQVVLEYYVSGKRAPLSYNTPFIVSAQGNRDTEGRGYGELQCSQPILFLHPSNSSANPTGVVSVAATATTIVALQTARCIISCGARLLRQQGRLSRPKMDLIEWSMHE